MPRKLRRARTTIHVDENVLKVFRHLSDVTGLSLAKTLGDWLAQTADGAAVIAKMYGQARSTPERVMREMHLRAEKLLRDVDPETYDQEMLARHYADLAEDMERSQGKAPAAPRPGVTELRTPRPVIRGDILPHRGQKRG